MILALPGQGRKTMVPDMESRVRASPADPRPPFIMEPLVKEEKKPWDIHREVGQFGGNVSFLDLEVYKL